jgi:hypothetical protein
MCLLVIRGSYQKFCTLFVFSLKINLFHKIHLQAFNAVSIVLYHSGPAFGKVFYSCLDAFVVDASDYSGHLIRHLLNASEAFPKEWFLQFWKQSQNLLGLKPPDSLKRKHTVCRTFEMTHVSVCVNVSRITLKWHIPPSGSWLSAHLFPFRSVPSNNTEKKHALSSELGDAMAPIKARV